MHMNFEQPVSDPEQQEFVKLLTEMRAGSGGYIEYQSNFPKYKFLAYLLKNGYLLHGSSVDDLGALEPRQANDKSKKSGNQKAVYAVSDPVLPLFYAIKDRKRLHGMVHSGYSTDEHGVKKYSFQIDGTHSEKDPWKNGVVHILPKESFAQTMDDEGELTDEWVSYEPVTPAARLQVMPEDFPYLNEVKVVKEG